MAAGAVKAAAVLTPFAVAWLAVFLLSGRFYRPEGAVGLVVWLAQSLVVSLAVSALVERVTRRALPLATLLNMTLVFPDHAPSRFSVALKSGTLGRLRQRVNESADRGLGTEDQEAAQRAVELIALLSRHDRLTRGHTERVRAYSDLIAEELGLASESRDKLAWGAMLHDIGKLTVPPQILNKDGRPNAEEWHVLQGHPAASADLLGPLLGWLGEWGLAASQHHERWDGEGYPAGLAGENISLAGRITAVADAYDVITSRRSYKAPMSAQAARQELIRCAGTQFDPDVVRAFLNVSLGRRWLTGPLASLLELPGVINIGSNLPAATNVVAGAIVAAGSVVVPTVGGWVPTDELALVAPDTTEVESPEVITGLPDTAPNAPPTTGSGSTPVEGSTDTTEPISPDVPGSTEPSVPPPETTVTTSATTINSSAPTQTTVGQGATSTTALSGPATTGSTVTTTPTPTPATANDTTTTSSTTSTTTTTTAPTTSTTSGAPEAAADFVTVDNNRNISIYVLGNDDQGNAPFDEDTLTITSDPQHASAFWVNGDHIRYKSDNGYGGTDTIEYEICNDNGLCAGGIVTITVIG